MKINNEILQQEKQYLAHLEKSRHALREEARKCFALAEGLRQTLSRDFSEYIGKRVKVTCRSKHVKERNVDSCVCYFEGFVVESDWNTPSSPVIRLNLFKIKKDGTESKMKFHLPYYTEEILEIELAE